MTDTSVTGNEAVAPTPQPEPLRCPVEGCPTASERFADHAALVAHVKEHIAPPAGRDPEGDFTLHVMVNVSGYGRKKDQYDLARRVKQELEVALHTKVTCDIVNVANHTFASGERTTVQKEWEVTPAKWRNVP